MLLNTQVNGLQRPAFASSPITTRCMLPSMPRVWQQKHRHTVVSHRHRTRQKAAQQDIESGTELLSPSQLEERLRQTVALIKTADLLAPYDPYTFNVALLLWRKIAALPESIRPRLLQELNSNDIRLLWRLTARRYLANSDEVANTLAGWSIAKDLPTEPGQVVQYNGKAALPLHVLGISSFKKLFTLHPTQLELFGRVDVNKGIPGHVLYPLYFDLQPKVTAVIASEEPADIRLEYFAEPPSYLKNPQQSMAQAHGFWPQFRAPLPPFGGGLVDYVRAVGPGVYVGVGWKEGKYPQQLPTRFLPFLMVKTATYTCENKQ